MDAVLRLYLAVATGVADRIEQARRDDSGQGTIEYIGMIIVAAAIVLAIMSTNMGDTIKEKFTSTIENVLGGGS
jgi:Flp pilus assembly pilin Flp